MPEALASRLQIKHLRLIAAIAEHRQLSLAAQMLAMTQPAASRLLAEIEAMTGAPLFLRHPKGMTVTPVGEGLARHARNIVEEIRNAAVEVEQLRLGQGGQVRIGAVTGAAVGFVVPAIRRLKTIAPQVELHIEVATSEELLKGLAALRHDMVLGRPPAGARPGEFTLQRASGERVAILASRRNPFAGRQVSLAALGASPWVMMGPGAPMRQAIDEGFAALGVPAPANVVNTASLLVMLSLLRDAEVLSAASQEVADLLTARQPDLVQLDLAERMVVAPYSLITLTGRRLSPVAARCRDLMAEVLRARQDPAV